MTVNSLLVGTCSEHGVRQLAPIEVVATAPAGSELSCSVACPPDDEKYSLTVEPQALNSTPHPKKTIARASVPMFCPVLVVRPAPKPHPDREP